MSQAISRKWRPRRFDDVIGQEHVTRTLQQAIASDRVGHAYLFCGPRGTGKTTSARLLAKAVNCLHEDRAQRPCAECRVCQAVSEGRFLDLIEIDAASNTGVDDIRDLRDKINFAPSEGRFKVYIIDEVHMLSTAAFNALLKTLEEPPPHAIFVLATTEEHKVLATIKSRCQQFNFRLLTQPEIIGRLSYLAQNEGLSVEPEALQLIAQEGAGSIRDAESLLDQLVTAPGDTITLKRAQQVLGTASMQAVSNLVENWLSADSVAGLNTIHGALSTGTDARQFCRQMVTYLRQLLLLRSAGDQLPLALPQEQKAVMLNQANRAPYRDLIATLKHFNTAAMAPTNSWQPQLPLELAFVESLPDDAAPPPNVVTVIEETPTQQAKPISQPIVAAVQQTTPPVRKEVEQAVVPPSNNGEHNSTLTLHTITNSWSDMRNLVKQRDRSLPAMLAHCKPLGIEGDAVILGFSYPILREKFDNSPTAKTIVGDALSQATGTKCVVRTVISSEYKPPQSIKRADVEKIAKELGGVVREI